MAPRLSFEYECALRGFLKVQSTASAIDVISGKRSLREVAREVERELGVEQGQYDIWDGYGLVQRPEDLKRAVKIFGEAAECKLEIREHSHIANQKKLSAKVGELEKRLAVLEEKDLAMDGVINSKIQIAKKELGVQIGRLDSRLNEVCPKVEVLITDVDAIRKALAKVQDKLGNIDVQELQELMLRAAEFAEQVKYCLVKVVETEHRQQKDKAMLDSDIDQTNRDLTGLRSLLTGKLDVLVITDADLRRDLQLLTESVGLLKDDHRLVEEDMKGVKGRVHDAIESSGDIRDLMNKVRAENERVRLECDSVSKRVFTIEGEASDKWPGFAAGVVYFSHWHSAVKGGDVQLNHNQVLATSRGLLARTGVVITSDEGLVVGDGPCRRFGVLGNLASYYEVEIEEICSCSSGAGGIYVGFSLSSAEEILQHPKNEFDAWLVGGNGKALVYRASYYEGQAAIPATFSTSTTAIGGTEAVAQAVRMLKAAMPWRVKGDVKEFPSPWSSEDLAVCNRVGVLFRFYRTGGAVLKVFVNGAIAVRHHFPDAPCAEAVGFLTPIVRVAGGAKTVRMIPGRAPEPQMLADGA